MMDKDEITGESLILIDFDLAAYGYRYFPRQRIPAYASPLDRLVRNDNFRGYDAAFVLKQISSQAIKDGLTDDFMSDEDINEWLLNPVVGVLGYSMSVTADLVGGNTQLSITHDHNLNQIAPT